MASLSSPGVLVTVSDESTYISGTSTSTPLIFVATAANKSYKGKTCPGTLESNVLRLVTSPSQLLEMYGEPVFYTDKYGNALHGASNNEYGVWAAFQYLNAGSSCYIIRADVDSSFPYSNVLSAGSWITGATNSGTGTISPVVLGAGSSTPESWTLIYDGVFFQATGSVTGIPVDPLTGQTCNLVTVGTPWSSAGTEEGSINLTVRAGTINYQYSDTFTVSTFYDTRNTVQSGHGYLSNFTLSNSAVAETITITVTQQTVKGVLGQFIVRGSYSGYIGTGTVGTPFISNMFSFTVSELTLGALVVGDVFSTEVFMNHNTTFSGYGNGEIVNVVLLPYNPQAETWSVIAKAALQQAPTYVPSTSSTPTGVISDLVFFDSLNPSENPEHITHTDTFTMNCVAGVDAETFSRSSSPAKNNLTIDVADNAVPASYLLNAQTVIGSSITGNISAAVEFNGGVNTNPVVDNFKFTLAKTLSLSNLPTIFPWTVTANATANQFFGKLTVASSNAFDVQNWFNTVYGAATLTVSNVTTTALGNLSLKLQAYNCVDINSSSASISPTTNISMIDISSLESAYATWKLINLISPSGSLVLRYSSASTSFVIASNSGFSNNVTFSCSLNTDSDLVVSASISNGTPTQVLLINGSGTWTDGDTFSLIIRPQMFFVDDTKVNYVNIGGATTDVKTLAGDTLATVKFAYPSVSSIVAGYSVNTVFGLCNYTITDVNNVVNNFVVCNTTPRSGTNVFTLGSGLQFVWSYTPTVALPYPTIVATSNTIGSGLTFTSTTNTVGSLNNLVLTPVFDGTNTLVSYTNAAYTNNYITGAVTIDPIFLGNHTLTVGDNFTLSESVVGFTVSRNSVIVGNVTTTTPYVDNPANPSVTLSLNGALVAANPYLATDIYSFNIAPTMFSVNSAVYGNLSNTFGLAKINEVYNFNAETQTYGDAPLSFVITQGNTPWVQGDSIVVKTIVNTFSVAGSKSGTRAPAKETSPGVWNYKNGIISFTITQVTGSTPWVAGDNFSMTVSGVYTPKYPNTTTDAQKRALITTEIVECINTNENCRSDANLYALCVAPGYSDVNVTTALVTLISNIKYEAGIVSHTPYWLDPVAASIWASTNQRKNDWCIWYNYASGLSTNVNGSTIFVDGTSVGLVLLAYADINYPVWFAPLGVNRGKITSLIAVGYVKGTLGTPTTFVNTGVTESQRGILYQSPTNVNPASEIAGKGILMMGQKTSNPNTSALDRINVSRLVMLMKRDIRFGLFGFIGDPNDATTWSSISGVLNNYCADKVSQRALFDYVVVCDSSTTSAQQIDNNAATAAVIIKPTKSLEFLYVPLTIRSTSGSMSI